MAALIRPWGHIHYQELGPKDGLPILLMNSLGTDLRMWDAVAKSLPELRIILCDKRGHGLSTTPIAPWTIADLASDSVALLDALDVGRALVGGCSIGAMTAMEMGATVPDRVAGLFLTSSGLRAGTEASWQARIDAVAAGGMAAVTRFVVEHWFTARFLASPEAGPWISMVARNDPVGYIGTCRVLAATDLTARVAKIHAPTLFVLGTEDPYNSVQSVGIAAALIPGSRIETIPGVAHIPAIESPERTAELLREFHLSLA